MAKTYITAQGDVWDQIARDTMGAENYAPELMRENWQHIRTAVFPGGVELRIPERDEASADAVAPWRRTKT